jgi:gluconokinase
MIVVVMGVSGSGKTEIGRRLAERLGCEFIEGDDFHPAANVAKMAGGTPLVDEDRWPWLARLNEELQRRNAAVLACSALKDSYRTVLQKNIQDIVFAHLAGSFDLIQSRLAERKHRYMPASLLQSQFETLEPPRDAIVIDIAQAPEACIAAILTKLPRYSR